MTEMEYVTKICRLCCKKTIKFVDLHELYIGDVRCEKLVWETLQVDITDREDRESGRDVERILCHYCYTTLNTIHTYRNLVRQVQHLYKHLRNDTYKTTEDKQNTATEFLHNIDIEELKIEEILPTLQDNIVETKEEQVEVAEAQVEVAEAVTSVATLIKEKQSLFENVSCDTQPHVENLNSDILFENLKQIKIDEDDNNLDPICVENLQTTPSVENAFNTQIPQSSKITVKQLSQLKDGHEINLATNIQITEHDQIVKILEAQKMCKEFQSFVLRSKRAVEELIKCYDLEDIIVEDRFKLPRQHVDGILNLFFNLNCEFCLKKNTFNSYSELSHHCLRQHDMLSSMKCCRFTTKSFEEMETHIIKDHIKPELKTKSSSVLYNLDALEKTQYKSCATPKNFHEAFINYQKAQYPRSETEESKSSQVVTPSAPSDNRPRGVIVRENLNTHSTESLNQQETQIPAAVIEKSIDLTSDIENQLIAPENQWRGPDNQLRGQRKRARRARNRLGRARKRANTNCIPSSNYQNYPIPTAEQLMGMTSNHLLNPENVPNLICNPFYQNPDVEHQVDVNQLPILENLLLVSTHFPNNIYNPLLNPVVNPTSSDQNWFMNLANFPANVFNPVMGHQNIPECMRNATLNGDHNSSNVASTSLGIEKQLRNLEKFANNISGPTLSKQKVANQTSSTQNQSWSLENFSNTINEQLVNYQNSHCHTDVGEKLIDLTTDAENIRTNEEGILEKSKGRNYKGNLNTCDVNGDVAILTTDDGNQSINRRNIKKKTKNRMKKSLQSAEYAGLVNLVTSGTGSQPVNEKAIAKKTSMKCLINYIKTNHLKYKCNGNLDNQTFPEECLPKRTCKRRKNLRKNKLPTSFGGKLVDVTTAPEANQSGLSQECLTGNTADTETNKSSLSNNQKDVSTEKSVNTETIDYQTTKSDVVVGKIIESTSVMLENDDAPDEVSKWVLNKRKAYFSHVKKHETRDQKWNRILNTFKKKGSGWRSK